MDSGVIDIASGVEDRDKDSRSKDDSPKGGFGPRLLVVFDNGR